MSLNKKSKKNINVCPKCKYKMTADYYCKCTTPSKKESEEWDKYCESF